MSGPDARPLPPLPGPLPLNGARGNRKEPRWVIPFLRALARTGEVRAAAEDAGIDHTTAYVRRRTHVEFAGLWRGALAAHERWKQLQQEEGIAAIRDAPSPGSPPASSRTPVCPQHTGPAATSPPERGRGELVASAGRVKRVGEGRWTQAKEKAFFAELAATANVSRAAKAAGVSTNAVYARRMKQPLFRAKWDAVLETGRAAIEMKLVEAANRTFDPDELDVEIPEQPKVSVAEAIRIVQLHGSRKQQEELPDPYAEEAANMSPDDVEELRERIIRKLRRMRERDMPDRIAEGWSFDEEADHMVPPGWVRAGSKGPSRE